jgi:hypothetical protein
MTVYTVTFRQRLDDYAVIQTLVGTDISPGQSFTLAGLGAGWTGTYVAYACPEYLYTGTDTEGNLHFDSQVPIPNQVLFYSVGDDLERVTTNSVGTINFTPTCTWITAAQIEDYIGLELTGVDDAAFLVQCAGAANAFAYRRRVEAGYLSESLSTVPSADVSLGTIMVGAAYFRQRGSFNTIASFDGMGIAASNGITPMVLQLLGINRPQVA